MMYRRGDAYGVRLFMVPRCEDADSGDEEGGRSRDRSPAKKAGISKCKNSSAPLRFASIKRSVVRGVCFEDIENAPVHADGRGGVTESVKDAVDGVIRFHR